MGFEESGVSFGLGRLAVIAGPCALEGLDHALMIAEACKRVCDSLGVGYVFKGSYDKANRTSGDSFRGPGMEEGLRILSEVHRRLGVPVLTDVHETWQVGPVAEAVQIVQIPAFLCRQTDLVMAAASSGRVLNVKKAQFLAPEDMASVVEKCRRAGNHRVLLCERGSVFGYRQLVVDFRSLPIMRELGCPVVFDATHSVQSMGGLGGRSGGDRRFVRPLLRCAASLGADAFFLEVHEAPDRAPSDGPNMVPLEMFEGLLSEAKGIWDRAMESGFASLDWVERP
ncbi:MAG: 3-deoxy-8-phosphooctulonate synthase [Thermanaerothrix sp.]|nr:3-deoxy-8-phosphooctulonate synthase [Thermanaerothrix sp.]